MTDWCRADTDVVGSEPPNPDLTITSSSWTPTSPVETDAITASATVRNAGTAASGATNVNFYLGTTKLGTANVPADDIALVVSFVTRAWAALDARPLKRALVAAVAADVRNVSDPLRDESRVGEAFDSLERGSMLRTCPLTSICSTGCRPRT